jgi:hypothetical protein
MTDLVTPQRRTTDPLPEHVWVKRLFRFEMFSALGLLLPVVQLITHPEQAGRIPVTSVPVVSWQILFASVSAWQLYAAWRDFPPVRKPQRLRVWAAFASCFCWFLLMAALWALAPWALLTYIVTLIWGWTTGICLNLNLSEEV